MKKIFNYFTIFEWCLMLLSVITITTVFIIFDKRNYLYLICSLIGAIFIMFNAKANPIGQVLSIIFAILYSIISYSYRYYGEMITYAGMTLPMAIIALITWLRHPHGNNKSEVEVNTLPLKEIPLLVGLTIVISIAFYFILRFFETPNLIVSTFSIATSFAAVYLTIRRSPYFSVAYLLNDIVLIILWSLAAVEDKSYISMAVCFGAFMLNDIYCFINWLRLRNKQKVDKEENK